MANPLHHPPDGLEVQYFSKKFHEDMEHEMDEYHQLMARASVYPGSVGISDDQTREISHGLGLISFYHQVLWWEAIDGQHLQPDH
jgi:hypothetical protein